MNELKTFCGGKREIHVSRELTKKFEEHVGDNIDKVIDYFGDKEIIGEFTIVIKGLNKNEQNRAFNKPELKKELNDLSNKFKELKSLIYEYRDKKENEISKLNTKHIHLKNEIELSQQTYEKLIDEATNEISNFVKKANLENLS